MEIDVGQFITETIEDIDGVRCRVYTVDCNEYTVDVEAHQPCGGRHRYWTPDVPPDHTHE